MLKADNYFEGSRRAGAIDEVVTADVKKKQISVTVGEVMYKYEGSRGKYC